VIGEHCTRFWGRGITRKIEVHDQVEEFSYSILKFFQVDIIGMFRMTSSARYRKDGVGSSRPNWR